MRRVTMDSGKLDEAIQRFKNVLELEPGAVDALLLRAKLCMLQNKIFKSLP